MNYFWEQLLQLGCSTGTAEGFNGLVATGLSALLVVGVAVIAVGLVWQIPQAWRQVLAEESAKQRENPVALSASDPAPFPDDDVPPTSDI